MSDFNLKEKFELEESLESWVMEKVDSWRDHYDNNYKEKHDE